jgi:hypothetical protein
MIYSFIAIGLSFTHKQYTEQHNETEYTENKNYETVRKVLKEAKKQHYRRLIAKSNKI